MKINCLMGTYGRYTLACDALACFLQQTVLADARLIILNQHPSPLHFDHPHVRVINEQMPGASLRKIRARMVELADPDAQMLHWWDDDDLVLPWHLEDGLNHLGTGVAWKPRRSWIQTEREGYTLALGPFEATIMYEAAALRASSIETHPEYPDHPIYLQVKERIGTTELGDLSSYLCRWSTGVPHHSFERGKTHEDYDRLMDKLRAGLKDPGTSSQMVVPDIWPLWQDFLDGIVTKVSAESHAEIERRLRAASDAANAAEYRSAAPAIRTPPPLPPARVACVMGTYGRYTVSCESLACFVQQTAIEDATLIILNQHPVPLEFDHPRVRVVNEQMPPLGIRRVRMRLIELAQPDADFIHWWDDDDLYLPWHLEDCLRNVGDYVAWKPSRSWVLAEGRYKQDMNYFEASTIMNAAALRAEPTDAEPGFVDHPFLRRVNRNGQLKASDLGDLTSYIYRWDTSFLHGSAKVEATQEGYGRTMQEVRENAADAGRTEMVLPDLWPIWQHFLDSIESQVSEQGHTEIFTRLALADSRSKLGAGGGT